MGCLPYSLLISSLRTLSVCKGVKPHNHPISSNSEYSFNDNDLNLFMNCDLELLRSMDENAYMN